MIWFGSKKKLQEKAHRIPKTIEFWNIFPKKWYEPEMWWAPFRTYFRFIFTLSVPRLWVPYKADGWGLCSYCKTLKWIEDKPINNNCNACRQWIEQAEQALKYELTKQQQQIWDTCKCTHHPIQNNMQN